MKALATLALVVALSGCVSQGNWDQLPQADQARFMRCRHAMQPALCGDDQDVVYVTGCIRGAEANYSDQGARERRTWLLEQGCPASMVNPGAYSAAEPPDAPMSRRAAPAAVQAPAETPGQAGDDEVAK